MLLQFFTRYKYKLLLFYLISLSARGVINAFLVRNYFEVPFLPLYAILISVIVLPFLIECYVKPLSRTQIEKRGLIIIIGVGLSSWVPMLMGSVNWIFISIINLGMALSVLQMTGNYKRIWSTALVFSNLLVQDVFFGVVHLSPVDGQGMVTSAATAYINDHNWIALGMVYLGLGVFTTMNIFEREQALNQAEVKVENQIKLQRLFKHNLQTPLQNIMLQLEILKMHGASEKALQSIHKSIQQVSESAQDNLLAKGIQDKNATINAGEFVRRLLAHFPEKIQIISTLEEAEPIPKVLFTALLNFVENALKFDAGMPKVFVSRLKNGLYFIVEDAGQGMNIDELKNYGLPTTSKTGGMGVGVHLSVGLLRELGYHLCVQSNLGKGTKVEIRYGQPSPLLTTDLKKGVKVFV